MTHKTLAIIVIFIAIVLALWQPQTQSDAPLNTYLKSQKTVVYQTPDITEYTYQQVGKTCYEDVAMGRLIAQRCH